MTEQTDTQPTTQATVSPEPTSEGHAAEPSREEVARTIAQRLGETEPVPFEQIRKHIWELGRTQTLALMEEALQIEERGGMLVPDGSRRRTVGGIFFFLARTKGVKKKKPPYRPRLPRLQEANPSGDPVGQGQTTESVQGQVSSTPTPRQPVPAVPPAPTFRWEDRIAVLAEIGNEKGAANVKLTVIGRPGKVVDKGTCVITSVQSTKVPALPKGLPTPSSTVTTYTVYIASKQWKKVAESITTDPEDVLILEGFPQFDSKTNSIAVFVSNASTKKLQQAQKQAQKGEAPA